VLVRNTSSDRRPHHPPLWPFFHDIEHGDLCPKGRKAEDGKIPSQYQLTETPSASYLQRTEWNVRDSDGTVIFTVAAALAGGSKRTAEFAKKHGKPWLHLSERGSYESAGERLAAFIREHDIKVLNVAGSRGSKEPGVASSLELAALISMPALQVDTDW
jgi:hypothetical protein